jgi:glycosyltransferase involved in cell wall biosynthesis
VPTSLIVTTRNEAAALPILLTSIAAQTRSPDEIVVVDGGSTDGTLEILRANVQRLPLRIISLPGSNISQGRNAAIRAATGDLICATDAGVRLNPCWLEELCQPLEASAVAAGNEHKMEGMQPSSTMVPSDARVDVVSGFFLPDPHSVFEMALAATTLPALADIRPEKFLPSSRSIAFRKQAWERVHGYPEWLDYCEDLIFDFALRRAGCRFAFAPRAVAYFRPRKDLPGFFKQYYRYARGDGKANLWFKRHMVRYATYLLALPLLLVLTFTMPMAAFALWVIAFLAMFYTPYKRLAPMLRGLNGFQRLQAIAWVPAIRVIGDVAKMIGYPVGVVWRIRHRRQPVDTAATAS